MSTRSGLPVIVQDGRLLGSSFDPAKEAASWASRVSTSVDDGVGVIVLGIGSGYHVAALVEHRPDLRIVVIESQSEIAAEARKLCPALDGGAIVVEPEPSRLFRHGAVADLLGGRFVIAPFGPSWQLNEPYYIRVQRLLMARDKEGFIAQLATRPELRALLDAAALAKLADEPVSIKSLQKLFAAAPRLSYERRLWKVLEELVS